MNRLKVIVFLSTIFLAQNLFAQVDTVSIQFIPDMANTFKLRCQAQKVNFSGADTLMVPFELSDTVDGAYTFNWGGTLEPQSADDIPLASYEFTDSGNYTITLSVFEKATGLTYTDTKSRRIRDIIRVPNVFTPNGDGVNDLFIIRANGIVPLEISVFSRTGTLVFNTRSPIIVWDGKSSSGADLSEGIYFYVLKSDDPKIPVQKGFFHLYNKNP